VIDIGDEDGIVPLLSVRKHVLDDQGRLLGGETLVRKSFIGPFGQGLVDRQDGSLFIVELLGQPASGEAAVCVLSIGEQ